MRFPTKTYVWFHFWRELFAMLTNLRALLTPFHWKNQGSFFLKFIHHILTHSKLSQTLKKNVHTFRNMNNPIKSIGKSRDQGSCGLSKALVLDTLYACTWEAMTKNSWTQTQSLILQRPRDETLILKQNDLKMIVPNDLLASSMTALEKWFQGF